MNPIRSADNEADVLAAARAVGFPVALKTAVSGITHKTDCGGVSLNLDDDEAVLAAYRDMSALLGHKVSVSPMVAGSGVEMMIGMTRDEQFGPLVVFGFGGVHAEVLNDCACALPPIDAQNVLRLLDALKMRPLLDGYRGAESVALKEFCELVTQFSQAVVALDDAIAEIDMNPVIVNSTGCVVVDALVVGNVKQDG
jgi:hypothetical protein